jgi:hypothetical protein
MPLKKSVRIRKRARANTSKTKKSRRTPWWTDTRVIGAAAVCIMGAAIAVAVYQSPDPSDFSSAHRRAETTIAGMARTPAATGTESLADMSGAEPVVGDTAPEPKAAPVTITGCLERSDDTFRLKDTTGAAAPKARSWKSGFLKKGPAPIEIVDASKRLNLQTQVGRRVSVTGTLVDRELHVRSLQRIGASCTNPPKLAA